ncbi:putative MFS transporter [Paratrimastix pyriformis]|uniref:MFS transporter n=1 Tax=Paratrimastix pyriformis TaxID=342808 RepID=A0ABQ8UWJ1_9EUKA|nr:putative MFS transporter [Paratrimastix pyriformis]
MLALQLTDAFFNPIIGWLSDATRSRWGKRRPWLFCGSLPFAVSFLLIWWAVPIQASWARFIYYLGCVIGTSIMSSCVVVPYSSLTSDLSHAASNDATLLTSSRMVGSMLSGTLSAFCFGQLLGAFPSNRLRESYLLAGGVMATVIALSPLVTCFGIREAPSNLTPLPPHGNPAAAERSTWKALKLLGSSPPFVILCALYTAGCLEIAILQANLLLYIHYSVRMDAYSVWTIGLVQLSAAVWCIIWYICSRWLGKRAVLFLGALILGGVEVGLYFARPGGLAVLFSLAATSGIGLSALQLAPLSMLSDVVDYGELRSGVRHEGLHYGLLAFFQKVSVAAGLAATSWTLGSVGFVPLHDAPAGTYPPQSPAVIQCLRIYVSWLPFGMTCCVALGALVYPLSRRRCKEIAEKLAQRQVNSPPPPSSAPCTA